MIYQNNIPKQFAADISSEHVNEKFCTVLLTTDQWKEVSEYSTAILPGFPIIVLPVLDGIISLKVRYA